MDGHRLLGIFRKACELLLLRAGVPEEKADQAEWVLITPAEILLDGLESFLLLEVYWLGRKNQDCG
jgi:hypothetical protein